MNQPRQCPGCKTWYAPHVEKCECGKSKSTGVTFRAGYPINGGMGVVTPCTDGTTTKCKDGEHEIYINGFGGMQCRKCGDTLFI